ncbi:MAG: pyruvoyl-dependent arginine decarboxylase [Chloroflexota bacterium]
MLETPKKFTLVGATSEGGTELTAFDKCLLGSGIGNLNLMRVSSILPPNTKHVEKLEIPPGSLTPTAYGYITSRVPGEIIAAAVAIGINTEDTYGVIMEYSGKCTAAEAEATIRGMVSEAFAVRGIPLNKVMVKVVEHKVEKCGCAFAAVPLWY